MSKLNEDSELIKRAVAGNADAFESLINEYYEVMFKMAFKWCGNRRDAEDITQDACIKLARGISSYNGKSKFTSKFAPRKFSNRTTDASRLLPQKMRII